MNTQITDEGVADLVGLGELTILELDNTAITDDGLAHLADIPSLFNISLAGTQITDAGLQHLHALPRLGSINVSDTAVTNAGGMGVLGALAFSPEQLDIELKWIDEHVDGKPYGVDIVMPMSYQGKEEGLGKADEKTGEVDSDVFKNLIPP